MSLSEESINKVYEVIKKHETVTLFTGCLTAETGLDRDTILAALELLEKRGKIRSVIMLKSQS